MIATKFQKISCNRYNFADNQRKQMEVLENNQLRVEIDQKGAELKSVLNHQHKLEYMWSGDPAYWAKTSPVLFPIVGALKDNFYLYNGQSYQLPRHGFARDQTFRIAEKEAQSVTFLLASDDETLAVFPFPFEFAIVYTIDENRLTVTYQIENPGDRPLHFSVGGHPAFKVPLAKGTAYQDYRLQFEKAETASRWPISKDGLIEKEPVPFLQSESEIPLTKELFKKDAIVLKQLQSSTVRLISKKTPHGIEFRFKGFPYLGLWAAPNADFVCIEPWCGIADSVDTRQNFPEKEGIICLPAEEKFSVSWQVTFF